MLRHISIAALLAMFLAAGAHAAAPPEPTTYWLGVECLPVPSAVRSQLDLPNKEGLLVEAVAKDSPAAAAGVQRHDVLVRAGEQTLSDPRDLVRAIELAKGGKLSIELLRGGKRHSVEATPVERPKDMQRAAGPLTGDWETMQKWMDRMYAGDDFGGRRPPLRFRFLQPGAIVPRDDVGTAPLPENMSIVISKEGKEPAKIVVKRGDEKWDVNEKELDKLPADVRTHVDRMLGHNLFGMVRPDADGAVRDDIKPPHAVEMPEHVRRQFDALNDRMDRLMKEVEEIHKDRPEKPAEEK